MWTYIAAALGLFIIRKYQEYKWGWCKSKRNINGKVVVITGANSGIGKETAKELAKRGATLFLACRNKQSTLEAIEEIQECAPNGNLEFVKLDLSQLASVKECARAILSKTNRIDILINNAGLSVPPEQRMITADGYEIHFGVNHLGHFLLTELLLETIKKTPDSRILIVSSTMYENGYIDTNYINELDKLIDRPTNDRKGRNPLYSDSKLANILHANYLSQILKDTKASVHVLCPGFVKTNLMRYYLPNFGILKRIMFLPIAFFFMRSVRQGAQTSIHCAVSEELDGKPFGFYRNCEPCKLKPLATDMNLSKSFYDASIKLVDAGYL